MLQGNFYGLVITLLTIMAAILLASQTLNRNGFTIKIEYHPSTGPQQTPPGGANTSHARPSRGGIACEDGKRCTIARDLALVPTAAFVSSRPRTATL